jgi:glycosyltransferase involved in cell wall biosynthesis
VSNLIVSIITPVLNGEEYIEECISSVLAQSYPYIEHIIADGGSTDGTLRLIEGYCQSYPNRVRCYSEADRNAADAVNKAIIKAKGQIINILGADDTCPADAIQTVVELFKEDVNFLFGSCNYIKNGKVFRTVMARQSKKDELINGRFWVYGPAMFYRRKVFEEIGMFTVSDEVTIACDIDLLIRVYQKYHMHYTTKVLGNFRTRIWLLNGKSWEYSKAVLKALHRITKSYGGKCTWSNRMYCLSCVIDFFRPVLQPLYTLVDKILIWRDKRGI